MLELVEALWDDIDTSMVKLITLSGLVGKRSEVDVAPDMWTMIGVLGDVVDENKAKAEKVEADLVRLNQRVVFLENPDTSGDEMVDGIIFKTNIP